MALITFTTCDKIGAAERRFPSLQESRRTHRFFTCEQKPYPVWFGVGTRVILHSVNITGVPNENIVQNHLNVALLNVF